MKVGDVYGNAFDVAVVGRASWRVCVAHVRIFQHSRLDVACDT